MAAMSELQEHIQTLQSGKASLAICTPWMAGMSELHGANSGHALGTPWPVFDFIFYPNILFPRVLRGNPVFYLSR
jgi:hypothetical protein